jgi:hypothetical protein
VKESIVFNSEGDRYIPFAPEITAPTNYFTDVRDDCGDREYWIYKYEDYPFLCQYVVRCTGDEVEIFQLIDSERVLVARTSFKVNTWDVLMAQCLCIAKMDGHVGPNTTDFDYYGPWKKEE